MKDVIITFILFLIVICSSDAQINHGSSRLDVIVDSIAINIAPQDTDKALQMADSLLRKAHSKSEIVVVLMLQADILTRKDRYYESLKILFTTLDILEKTDYKDRSWVYSYIGTQYRVLGFFNIGQSFLEEAQVLHQHIEDPVMRRFYRGKSLNEEAQFAMDRENYEEAEKKLHQALYVFAGMKEEPYLRLFIAKTQQLLGVNYLQRSLPERALEAYLSALQFVEKEKATHTPQAGLIYQGLGESYLSLGLLEKADDYLQKALRIAQKGEYTGLKLETFRSLKQYYSATKNMEGYQRYSDRLDSLVTITQRRRQAMINGASYYLTGKKEEEPEASGFFKGKEKGMGVAAILLVLIGGIFIVGKKRKWPMKNKDAKKEKDREDGEPSFDEFLSLPKNTKEELKRKLACFENRKAYLNPQMSFANMVTELDTNAKYLNYALHHLKEKDFRTYLNDLRIDYMLLRLKNEPTYRSYKLSFLAEECGFTSYSAFAANFKRCTGSSPSLYLKKLKKKDL